MLTGPWGQMDPENYSPVSLSLGLGKVRELLIWSAIMWHIQLNQGIKSSQHSQHSAKASPAWPTRPPLTTRWPACWLRERLWLCLPGPQQTLWCISHCLFLEKLAVHGWDGWTPGWAKSWLMAGLRKCWWMEKNPAGGWAPVGCLKAHYWIPLSMI